MDNILYSDLWGAPWNNGMAIFHLSPIVCEQLYNLAETSDPSSVEFEFPELWSFVENFIEQHGPCFFRLSTASPKDSTAAVPIPILKGLDANHVFSVCFQSDRFCEELYDAWMLNKHSALTLKRWDNEIESGDEYRIFVSKHMYELAVCMSNSMVATGPTAKALRDYTNQMSQYFPAALLVIDVAYLPMSEKIIFIEFNPVDNELDTYDIDEDMLSHEIRCALHLPSENYTLYTQKK
jgi:hypothetical protein